MPFWRGEDAPGRPSWARPSARSAARSPNASTTPASSTGSRPNAGSTPTPRESLRDHVARQVRVAGAVPDDRTVLIETFRDPAGEIGLAVLTPFGGKLHQALKLALQARLRQRLGIAVACLHGDDGILIRLPQIDEPPLDLFDGLTAERAEALIRDELGDSALFGLRFRQNAGRALLMPRPDPAKRTPLWLQRLRAKDLLQVVRRFPDFPIVVETYRECLNDDLDLPRLRGVPRRHRLGSDPGGRPSRRGRLTVRLGPDLPVHLAVPLPVGRAAPERSAVRPLGRGRRPARPAARPGDARPLARPQAIGRVEGRLRGIGRPPRTADEMAETLRRLGDLAPSELAGPMLGFLADLEAQGRAVTIDLAGTAEPSRWIGAEEVAALSRRRSPERSSSRRRAMPTGPLPRERGSPH